MQKTSATERKTTQKNKQQTKKNTDTNAACALKIHES